MPGRVEHKEEPITGIANTRRYAKAHSKHVRTVYRAYLKSIMTLQMSGKHLEVGAGPDILASLLVSENPNVNVTAMDLSPEMVAVGKEHVIREGLEDRIQYVEGAVSDENILQSVGTFDLVYTMFALHHWKNPLASLTNLWMTVAESGILYTHDFKKVRWIPILPLDAGDNESIRAVYVPGEIQGFLEQSGICSCEIRTLFPFFLLSVIARK